MGMTSYSLYHRPIKHMALEEKIPLYPPPWSGLMELTTLSLLRLTCDQPAESACFVRGLHFWRSFKS